MSLEITERLKQEQTLKTTIRETIDSICEQKNEAYKNICAYSARSESDKATVVNNIFDLMINNDLPSSLLGALSQVESGLDGWGE